MFGSLRIQLITVFFLSVLIGFGTFKLVTPLFQKTQIDYSSGMETINWRAQVVADEVMRDKTLEPLLKMIELESGDQNGLKILVTDETGKILYKTKFAEEETVDLHKKIRNVMRFAVNQPVYNSEEEKNYNSLEFTTFYPIEINNESLYLFVSGVPMGEVVYIKIYESFPIIIGIVVFLLAFIYITRHKMKQIEKIADGVNEIATGNLSYRIEKTGQDEIASLTENINHMAHKLMMNIENEREVEKRKNELITNVSHDLRTPLTSIMGYLRLLRDKGYESDAQHDKYVKVAFSKSEQLQDLIDDLFEYTKLNEGKIHLNTQKVCINKLLKQLLEELVPQIEERELSLEKDFSEELLYSMVDSELTVRLFDNLLMNAIKYSKDYGAIRVCLQKDEKYIHVEVSNQTEALTEHELEQLFDRFYKKDQSRSEVANSSGLGLAIAKSIAELQNGEINVTYDDGIVRFITTLPLLED